MLGQSCNLKRYMHPYVHSSTTHNSQDMETTWLSLDKWMDKDCCCVVLVTQSCLTLCDHMDCSPPGSSVHGILQARTLECIVIPFSRGSSQPRDQIQVFCTAGRFFTIWATRKPFCLYCWPTNRFIIPFFLYSIYMHYHMISVFLFQTYFTRYNKL